MRKVIKGLMMASFAVSFAMPALAVQWVTDLGYRVDTMGGATLGIEDETTALNLFNHENLSGLAFLKKMNRIDLGVFYTSDNNSVTYPATLFSPETKVTSASTDMELTRPGAEYRGVTYWLGDNLVVRAGIEGLVMNTTLSQTGSPDQKIDFSGLGGGASVAYKTDLGLALGAGIVYTGMGGKPGSLDGMFNIYGDEAQAMNPAFVGTTSKFEFSGSNFNWGVGAGYAADLAPDAKLSLGVQVGNDNTRPDASMAANLSSLDPLAVGDYTFVVDTAGSIDTLGFVYPVPVQITDKRTFTPSTMRIGAEAILNLGTMLEAGLLFDSKSTDVKYKDELTQAIGTNSASTSTDFKVASQSLVGITPEVRANLPLSEDMNLLPGVRFSTYGSGTKDYYNYNGTEAVKALEYKPTESSLAVGAGLQAMKKQLQVALQYEMGTLKQDVTQFDSSGNALGTVSQPDTNLSNLRLGGEYWVIPMLAIRAGYAMLNSTVKATSGDQKSNTGRITFGAGLAMPDGLTADLLIKLDTYTTDPAPDPKPTHTATGIYLGTRIPI